MSLLKLLKLLLLALLLGPVTAQAQAQAHVQAGQPVRIGYVFSDGNTPGTLAAYRKLIEERPDLKDRVELVILSESSVADTPAEQMAAVDVLIFDVMNQQMLDRFDDENGTSLLHSISAQGVVLGVGEGLQGEDHYRELGVTWDARARAYWQHGGPQNTLALLQLAQPRQPVCAKRGGMAQFVQRPFLLRRHLQPRLPRTGGHHGADHRGNEGEGAGPGDRP